MKLLYKEGDEEWVDYYFEDNGRILCVSWNIPREYWGWFDKTDNMWKGIKHYEID